MRVSLIGSHLPLTLKDTQISVQDDCKARVNGYLAARSFMIGLRTVILFFGVPAGQVLESHASRRYREITLTDALS